LNHVVKAILIFRTDFLHCQGKNNYLVAARIKSEKWEGWRNIRIRMKCHCNINIRVKLLDYDDVGAVNFEAICQSGERLSHRPMPSWINDRGNWSDFIYCPIEAPVICGIKSR